MESLKELYRIGTGPSSSHTMGPERAAHRFKEKYPQADRFLVTLYGSLAKTGKGHLTDDILVKTLHRCRWKFGSTFRISLSPTRIRWSSPPLKTTKRSALSAS